VHIAGSSSATQIESVTVVGCELTNFAYAGVFAQHVKRIKIDGNRIHDIAYAGIMLASCIDGSIDNNDVWNITQAGYVNSYGITASRTPGSLIDSPRSTGLSISSNRITSVPLWAGIDTHGGQGLLVSKNIIRDTGTAISLVSAQNAAMAYVFAPLDMEVADNLIDSTVTNGTRGAGINLSGNATQQASGKIHGNTVRGHGLQSAGAGAGIYLENTLGAVVTGNTVIEPAPSGINAYTSNVGFVISHNIVVKQRQHEGRELSAWFKLRVRRGKHCAHQRTHRHVHGSERVWSLRGEPNQQRDHAGSQPDDRHRDGAV